MGRFQGNGAAVGKTGSRGQCGSGTRFSVNAHLLPGGDITAQGAAAHHQKGGRAGGARHEIQRAVVEFGYAGDGSAVEIKGSVDWYK